MKRAAAFLVAGLIASACGEATRPAVSEITLSRSDISRGQQFFAMAQVMDEGGDFDQGQVHVDFRNLGEDQSVEFGHTMPVEFVEAGAKSAELVVGLRILGEMELDVFELALSVSDNTGERSVPSTIGFELIQ